MEPIDRDEVSELLEERVDERVKGKRARLMRLAAEEAQRRRENDANFYCIVLGIPVVITYWILIYTLGG